MGFSSSRFDQRRTQDVRPWKIHPIWRGIGCFLIVLIPILSYAAAVEFMRSNRWIPLPPELNQPIVVPYTSVGQVDQISAWINSFLSGILFGHIFFALVFVIIGFGLLSVLYSIFYRIAGPPRYGKYDLPPIKAPKRPR
jgi:hypothetical protein